jgi:hypothetical protein
MAADQRFERLAAALLGVTDESLIVGVAGGDLTERIGRRRTFHHLIGHGSGVSVTDRSQ